MKKEKIIKNSKKALSNEFKKRLFSTKEKLYAKIPELRPDTGYSAVHISKYQFKKLSDEEFSYLYYAPDLVIHVSKSTTKYIEKRRRELGLMSSSEIPPLGIEERTQKK